MISPFLSLAVPTYNRPEFLDSLLASIAGEIQRDPTLETQIEVLISDNASDITTSETVRRWEGVLSRTIRYRRNGHNLGGPGNLVEAIKASRGIYTMYVGDDDRLCTGAIGLIREVIRSQHNPPVCIFAPIDLLGAEEFALGPNYEKRLSVEEAAKGYFFSVGIPGGAIFRTDLALVALSRQGESFLSRTNWPQTVLAFLSAMESPDEYPIAVKHASIAHISEHHDRNTIYTARILWNTWVQGLVNAARLIEEATRRPLLSPACSDIFTPKRVWYPVEKIFDHLLLIDDDEELTKFSDAIQQSLEELPANHRGIAEELLLVSRTQPWLRVPTLIWRRVFSEQDETWQRAYVVLPRLKQLRQLLSYYRRHRLMVKHYHSGRFKNIRDYSLEGY